MRQHWRTCLLLNVLFYGLFAAVALWIAQYPELHSSLAHNAGRSVQRGWLAPVYQAYYVERSMPLAAVLTFAINLVVGSGLMLSLPSFIIPFSGILVLAYRSVMWGLLMGPKALHFAVFGTFFLEGQGYILAALGICIQGSWALRPRKYGYSSIKQAFVEGFKLTARLYVLIATVLLVAAIYESTAGIIVSRPVFPQQAGSHSLMQTHDLAVQFSGSVVFYNPAQTAEADARIIGVLLDDIHYFSRADTASARISQAGELFDIQLLLPSSAWEAREVQERFSRLCTELNRNFPNRKYQITAISIDSSGTVSQRTFF